MSCIIVLLSIQTTVNLLLPLPVYKIMPNLPLCLTLSRRLFCKSVFLFQALKPLTQDNLICTLNDMFSSPPSKSKHQIGLRQYDLVPPLRHPNQSYMLSSSQGSDIHHTVFEIKMFLLSGKHKRSHVLVTYVSPSACWGICPLRTDSEA